MGSAGREIDVVMPKVSKPRMTKKEITRKNCLGGLRDVPLVDG